MAQIGLQLFTIKEEVQSNIFAALDKVAEIGYEGVEFAGYAGATAKELRNKLDGSGLEAVGTHIAYNLLIQGIEEHIEYAQAIECKAMVCPMLPRTLCGDERIFHEAAEKFNRFGSQCRLNGLRFLYHIHGHEFASFARSTGFDILLRETDPRLVAFEFDTYWVESAHHDSLEYYREIGDRCPYIHFKDFQNREQMRDVEIGVGEVQVQALMTEGIRKRAEWFVVEHKSCGRPMLESIEISLRNMQKFRTEIDTAAVNLPV